MEDVVRPKARLESFAYALDLEIRVKLLGADFEIRAVCAVASTIERIVRAIAVSLDPQLEAIKLKMMADTSSSTLRLRPELGGDGFAKGLTASLAATALWSSVIGLKACIESSAEALSAFPSELAATIKREFMEIEKLLQSGQAVEVTCVIKETWEYFQESRRRLRCEEWQVRSGRMRKPGDNQPIDAEPQPLAGSAEIPLRWPFRPLSFFGPGDPFTPWWEKK
jgi:hypothetical protein